MLSLRTKDGETSVAMHGNLAEICSDLCICVRTLYDALGDKDLQKLFRQFAKDMLPVLPFQDNMELQEEEKKVDEAIGKVLGDDIVKKLSELVEMLK